MINSILNKQILDKKWYDSYLFFMEERSKIDEDSKGWLHWAKTRVGDCSSLLEFIPFQTGKDWKILELGARGSAFSSYLTLFHKDIIVSDNFQIGQNEGHIWDDFDKKSPFGDLKKWESRWKKIAYYSDRITAMEIDSRTIPFPDNYFDCIISVSVIEHIKNHSGFTEREDVVALQEAYRVLKPEGYFGITSDFDKIGKDEQDRPKIYDENSFIDIVKQSGFKFDKEIYDYKTEIPRGGFAILRK